MDMMLERDDDPDDEFAFHRRLTAAVVKVCCLTALARRDGQEDHRADLMTMADMITAELICHVYPRLTADELAAVVELHAVHVTRLAASRGSPKC
jgi:hypothetical protein